MKLNRMYVVLSAELSTLTAEQNAERSGKLRKYLGDTCLDFDVAEGCYKGVKETAFVVQVKTFEVVPLLLETAAEYGQESILLVDSRDKAYLLFAEGTEIIPLGKVQESTAEPASAIVSGYTKLGKRYYYTYDFDQEA